jgi:hypothetical protein
VQKLGLSYRSAKALAHRVGELPSGPRWSAVPIILEGDCQPTEPIFLYKRDAVECVEYLLNCPLFADHIDLVPVKHYTANGKRVFNEPISGMQAWETQVRK